jgi:LysM repeat protein
VTGPCRALLCICVGLLTISRAARAGETITYKVKQGDSVELIAAEFYGDRKHAVFILVANKLPHARKLRAGERLKVPTNREIITAPGDTLDSLATTWLGDPRRAPHLARFNGLDPVESVPAGAVLTIPLTVNHTAAGAESLANIAAAFFGDSKQAALLRDYNFLDKDALAKGETIVVPIISVRVRDTKLPETDAESKQRTEKLERSRIVARTALPRAYRAADRGLWAEVKAELAGLDLDFLDARLAVEVGLLIGQAHLASGDEPLALAAFAHAIERKPDHALDPYYYSPKVRDAWKKAGGEAPE